MTDKAEPTKSGTISRELTMKRQTNGSYKTTAHGHTNTVTIYPPGIPIDNGTSLDQWRYTTNANGFERRGSFTLNKNLGGLRDTINELYDEWHTATVDNAPNPGETP